jgi:hypothetical protein
MLRAVLGAPGGAPGAAAISGTPDTPGGLDISGAARRPGQNQPEVFFITGFVLHPFNKQETDGPPGAAALARTLAMLYGVRPVFIVPAEAERAVERLSALMGFSSRVIVFTKDPKKAAEEAERIMAGSGGLPAYCIAVEAAGANRLGVYHNASGFDVSSLEAKSDVLFTRLREKGVPTLALGDLGNECGMGTLGPHIGKYIPRGTDCGCPCGGGIAAASGADTVLSATVSNWGAWSAASALAYLARRPDALYDPELEAAALAEANRCGLIDMHGETVPLTDGMSLAKGRAIITLMNECVRSALELEESCRPWFEKTIALGFFDRFAAARETGGACYAGHG